MLVFTGVHRGFGRHPVLRDVDLRVHRGQVLGLLGANGAGKTTLINIATGLLPPDAGTITVAGIDVARHTARAQRHVGLAPQRLGIYPTLTVLANLESFAWLNGLRGREARRRVGEVAETFGLGDRLAIHADRLSGGQQRRLHTALATLHRPALLFLDEPTVGADVTSRAEILRSVRHMADNGTAVVYTTHHLAELDELDADIAVLHDGRVVAQGSRTEILARYASAQISLDFDGPPPPLPGWQPDPHNGNRLVPAVPATGERLDPVRAASAALVSLAGHADAARLRGVRLTQASLESAFLAITGHGLAPSTTEDTNVAVA